MASKLWWIPVIVAFVAFILGASLPYWSSKYEKRNNWGWASLGMTIISFVIVFLYAAILLKKSSWKDVTMALYQESFLGNFGWIILVWICSFVAFLMGELFPVLFPSTDRAYGWVKWLLRDVGYVLAIVAFALFASYHHRYVNSYVLN
jgi:hypothetical protein